MLVVFYAQISKFMDCICRLEGEVVVHLSYFDLFLDLLSLISCKFSHFIIAQPLISLI